MYTPEGMTSAGRGSEVAAHLSAKGALHLVLDRLLDDRKIIEQSPRSALHAMGDKRVLVLPAGAFAAAGWSPQGAPGKRVNAGGMP